MLMPAMSRRCKFFVIFSWLFITVELMLWMLFLANLPYFPASAWLAQWIAFYWGWAEFFIIFDPLNPPLFSSLSATELVSLKVMADSLASCCLLTVDGYRIYALIPSLARLRFAGAYCICYLLLSCHCCPAYCSCHAINSQLFAI